jgi:hypothetical protein
MDPWSNHLFRNLSHLLLLTRRLVISERVLASP